MFFSTYSEKFWPERLRWFQAQAAAGLIGPLDYAQTGQSVIVNVDGFRCGQASLEVFRLVGETLNVPTRLMEVDGSNLVCEFMVPLATGAGLYPNRLWQDR